MRRKQNTQAVIDRIVEQAYYARCCGIQIDIMDIPKVFRHGRDLIMAGADKQKLEDGVFDFVSALAKR
jgi:hypothetical protein